MQSPDLVKFNAASNAANRVALVFVHGFSGDLRATWGKIPDLLETSKSLAGWDFYGFGYSSSKWIDLLGLWSADPDLEVISQKLVTALDLHLKNFKFAFVAHSMGGLVVQRALLLSPALRDATTHVTFFGTPSGGLVKAEPVSWLKQQARDMAKGGPFITALRQDWSAAHLDTNPPFHFLTVAGEIDQFVDPASSLDPFPKSVQRVIPGDHLSMLRVNSIDDPCPQIILQSLTTGAAATGIRSAAGVAEDAGDFQQVITTLWPVRDTLDERGAVQLALALSSRNRLDDAIDLLKARHNSSSEALGVLAGRLKRRWLILSGQNDFTAALDLYRQGYAAATAANDCRQAYYHAVNIAYLLLAGLPQDIAGAKVMAQNVLNHCAESNDQSHWRLASEGDALIILGRTVEGFAKHRQAAAASGIKAWEALSMEEQALRVAELSGLSRANGATLAAIYEGA